MESSKCHSDTGKSVSEALIFESVNPQYDERLFIESPEKYKFRTCCVQKLFLSAMKLALALLKIEIFLPSSFTQNLDKNQNLDNQINSLHIKIKEIILPK